MKKLCVFLFVIAAMGAFALFANTASAAMSDGDFIKLCESGSLAEIQAAIKNGADANAKDEYGATALMAAAFEGNPEAISALLNNGADVNAKDGFGRTALMWAAMMPDGNENPETMPLEEYDAPEVISLLLENGADAAITDNDGKKAIDYMRVPDENSSGEYKSAYQSLKNASK
jgi:hypothetical protein